MAIGGAGLGALGTGWAQGPLPASAVLRERAAARFPQPVLVGALIDRQVLEPAERQDVLGRVATVGRGVDGGIVMVLRLGGVLGFGTRAVAVPIEAMVLMGEYVEVAAFSTAQLRALPTADESGVVPLPADAVIRVGLARPSH